MIGKDVKNVKQCIMEGRRPMLIRCQIGVAPAGMQSLSSPSSRSLLSPSSSINYSYSTRDSSSSVTDEEALSLSSKIPGASSPRNSEDLSICIPENDSSAPASVSPMQHTPPSDSESKQVHRFYRFVSPRSEENDSDTLGRDLSVSEVRMERRGEE